MALDKGQTSPSGDTDDADLPPEVVFEILRNSRRRRVLEHLESTGKRATIKELVEHIATEEHDIASLEPSRPEYKSIYVALLQSHLPKMDDAGIIHYDQENKTVELRDASSVVFRYLDIDHDDPRPSSTGIETSELVGDVRVVVPLSGGVQGTVCIEADENTLMISSGRPEEARDEEG